MQCVGGERVCLSPTKRVVLSQGKSDLSIFGNINNRLVVYT